MPSENRLVAKLPKKLKRKQIAAIKRHLKRKGIKMSVGSCRAIGGKAKGESSIISCPVVICRRGANRWELL